MESLTRFWAALSQKTYCWLTPLMIWILCSMSLLKEPTDDFKSRASYPGAWLTESSAAFRLCVCIPPNFYLHPVAKSRMIPSCLVTWPSHCVVSVNSDPPWQFFFFSSPPSGVTADQFFAALIRKDWTGGKTCLEGIKPTASSLSTSTSHMCPAEDESFRQLRGMDPSVKPSPDLKPLGRSRSQASVRSPPPPPPPYAHGCTTRTWIHDED